MKLIKLLPLIFCSVLAFGKPPVLITGTVTKPILNQGTSDSTAVTIPRVWVYLKVNAYSETDTAITFNLSIFRTKGKFANGETFYCNVPQALPAYPVPANGNVQTKDILAYIASYYNSQGYNAVIK